MYVNTLYMYNKDKDDMVNNVYFGCFSCWDTRVEIFTTLVCMHVMQMCTNV